MRDKDFCDEDGNVVIRLGRTLFKQYKARLAKYCGYFEELFAMGVSTETIDGCPVYRVPPELSLKEFRDLLTALEPLYVLVPLTSRVLATRRSQCRTKNSP